MRHEFPFLRCAQALGHQLGVICVEFQIMLDSFIQQVAAIPIQTLSEGIKSLDRSEEHTSELQSQSNLVCRLLLEKKKRKPVQVTFQRNLLLPLDVQRLHPHPLVCRSLA